MIISKPYLRERAVEYARRWARERNPLFADFTGNGGDCTNFVSQAIYAGSCEMNYTETFGWYYVTVNDRAPAWTSVEYFYDFFLGGGDFASKSERVGPYAREAERVEMEIGDVIQLADNRGDYYHTLIIVGFEGDEILIAAHSDDSLDRPLSSYNYASLRFVKIEGVNIEIPDSPCFERLFGGTEI